MNRTPHVTRRTFLMGALGAAASPAVARTRARRPAQDRVRVAVVGAGGRGADDINALADTPADIVALCDCDSDGAAESFKAYPKAAKYSDWRRLMDRAGDFDAAIVATPDHNHAIISIAAMRAGKHVYCEKPLAHSVWEARQMARAAAEMRVATQMGTQGHAFEGTRRAVEALRAGVIGELRELHVWTDRPAGWWPQGVGRPEGTPAVPASLEWDVWLGPAPSRPYNPAYVPFKWRGFWEFGTGAIGDMGIHNLDTAYWGLDLGLPDRIEILDCSPALTDPRMNETAPLWSILEIHFPAHNGRPAVKMTWYDGGKLPPKELFHGEPLGSKDGGSLVVGSKGTLYTRTWHGGQDDSDMFQLLPRNRFAEYKAPTPTLPRTPSHHREWIDACRGVGATQSPFTYAARLTESLILGNVALRVGHGIRWNAAGMKAPGCPEADRFIRPAMREGWTIS